ncbi:MAG TPA: hypothetical protein VF487_12405 [Chitinophagaceae bacterium]
MAVEKEIIHIGFNCPENIPEAILNGLTVELDTTGLNIEIKRLPIPIYNAFEWAIPGIIAAYILKPYFESFLKEAGKDHYNHLSKWLKSLVTKARHIKVHTVAASQSTEKLDSTYSQSKSISVYCQTRDDRIIKLLFDETLTDSDWQNAIDKIIELLNENYAKTSDDKLTEQLKTLNQKNRTFYAFIDRNTKEWIFKDDQELVQIRISNSKAEKN